MFPVMRHFKGGKGVATGGGVLLPLHPPVMIGTLIAWLLIMKVSKKASIASISIVPIMLIALAVRGTAGWELLALLGMGALVEIRHISNIKRLISGSEPPVTGVSH
jgi:glycerol-3-phosphate acyltransferase PlsY